MEEQYGDDELAEEEEERNLSKSRGWPEVCSRTDRD